MLSKKEVSVLDTLVKYEHQKKLNCERQKRNRAKDPEAARLYSRTQSKKYREAHLEQIQLRVKQNVRAFRARQKIILAEARAALAAASLQDPIVPADPDNQSAEDTDNASPDPSVSTGNSSQDPSASSSQDPSIVPETDSEPNSQL